MEAIAIRAWLDRQLRAEERIAREASASIPDPAWCFSRLQDLSSLYASADRHAEPGEPAMAEEDERVRLAWAALRKRFTPGLP
jgi:hypothetical protein